MLEPGEEDEEDDVDTSNLEARLVPTPRKKKPLSDFEDLKPAFMKAYRNLMQYNARLPPTTASEPYIVSAWICLMKAPPSRTSAWRTLERKWTAKIGGGYSHIELVLKDSNGMANCYTVDFPSVNAATDGTGKVRLQRVSLETAYPSPHWNVYQISTLSPAELMAINYYCFRQIGKNMNKWGLYANIPLFSWTIGESRKEEDSYFCSQLIASALRWIWPEQFARVNPRLCTPAQLYQILSENGSLFSSAVFRPLSMYDSSY